MPHKDPEKRREYQREYSRRRRESGVYAERERQKRQDWLARNPGYNRKKYLANRERVLELAKLWSEANPDRVRANKRAYERRLRKENPDRQRAEAWQFQLASRHGMQPEHWAAMWSAQQGLCYLCGTEMDQAQHPH